MEIKAPKWMFRLLRWFCKPEYADFIEGDLLELYDRSEADNKNFRNIKLAYNMSGFLRWRYLKNTEDFYPQSSIGMIKNYFKVTVRNISKNKLFTSINAFGLSLAMLCCLLITTFVRWEFSYDQHLANADHTYYVANGSSGRWTPPLMGSTLVRDYPEVEQAVRIAAITSFVGEIDNNMVSIDQGLMADSTFFEVFPQEFIYGTPNTALTAPNTMVLTQSLAENYFPGENPLGKTLVFEDEKFEVKAVVADPPGNTSLPFKFIIDLPRIPEVTQGNWTGNMFFTYVKLSQNADPATLEGKFPDFVYRYFTSDVESFGGNIDDYVSDRYASSGALFSLIPIRNIHLDYPHLSLGKAGKLSNVIVISIIALLILLVASINYVNMTTARAGNRLKEVGVRKVLGSLRSQLANQFFMESSLLTAIALVVGLIGAILLLPFFNELTQRSFEISDLLSLQSLLILFGLGVVTALFSGVYPAVYISSIKVINALKGSGGVSGSFSLRKVLVVFQFAVTVFLLAMTVIVFFQVNHMKSIDPGINTSKTYAVKNANTLGIERINSFKDELMSISGVESVSRSSMIPAVSGLSDWTYRTVEDVPRRFGPMHVMTDEHFVDVLDIELIEGRNFRSASASDSTGVLINETFAKMIGGDVLGKKLTRGPGHNFTILGVFKDFHATSVKRAMNPMIIRYLEEGYGIDNFLIKMEGNVPALARDVEKAWYSIKDDYPFEGIFIDQSFENLYQAENRFGRMFSIFSIVTIVISILGLVSLVSFVLEKKYKEIAIRKVLGADTTNITKLINRDFLKLVLFGSLIGVPISFYYGMTWLEEFAERIELGWMLLAGPIFVVLLLTLILVTVQTIKVAASNPVDALKQE
ncbi:MAG: ABC transporter permease [Cyclobacteriaceae bacterium]